MNAIIAALGPHQEALPDKVKELIQGHQESNAAAQAKALHRQISTQANATKQLSAVRKKRLQYLHNWQEYVQRLGETFQAQLAEKAEAMTAMDAEEEALLDTIEQAKATSLSLAGKELPSAMEDVEEMDDHTDPSTAEARQRLRHKEEAILAAIDTMQNDAAAEVKQRAGSRTPRRGSRGGAPKEMECISSDDGGPPQPFG